MEALTSPSDSAAAGPRWVLLHRCNGDDDSDSSADAKTTAASCTSSGLPFTVSFSVAAPPAVSSIHGGWLDGADGGTSSSDDDDDDEYSHSHAHGDGDEYSGCRDGDCCYAMPDRKDSKDPELQIIAVHDDAILMERRVRAGDPYHNDTFEYFLYEAGAGRRPPSLLLLPGCYITWHWKFERKAHGCLRPTARMMCTSNTGILRCGEDELLVAQLELPYEPGGFCDRAQLCVLCLSRQQEWELKRAVPIMFDDLEGINADEVILHWGTVTAVPVGSRFLCWVDYRLGFLLCDMAAADESLKLRYVALPVTPPHKWSYFDFHRCMKYSRNLASAGAGTGGAAVRFVDVEPRCSCGGHGRSTCARCFFFTVTTWTLSLSMEEPMEWVKISVLDCDELWALPAYEGLPQLKFELPIVSSDDPDVVCFMVHDPNFNDMREWMVEVDTRSKAILSVVPYTDRRDDYVAAKLGC